MHQRRNLTRHGHRPLPFPPPSLHPPPTYTHLFLCICLTPTEVSAVLLITGLVTVPLAVKTDGLPQSSLDSAANALVCRQDRSYFWKGRFDGWRHRTWGTRSGRQASSGKKGERFKNVIENCLKTNKTNKKQKKNPQTYNYTKKKHKKSPCFTVSSVSAVTKIQHFFAHFDGHGSAVSPPGSDVSSYLVIGLS